MPIASWGLNAKNPCCCAPDVSIGSSLCKNAEIELAVEVSSDEAGLCPDRLDQSTNAQNAHEPFHVVGQDVQRHFGTDVLECLHLEVRRSHPGLYSPEGMLDSLAAHPHLARIPIKPRLHSLKDGFVLPT